MERYVAEAREAELDRPLVDSYTRRPHDDVWSEDAARRMIASEPW